MCFRCNVSSHLGVDDVYVIASPFCVLGAMSPQHLWVDAVYVIASPFCVLDVMSPHIWGVMRFIL